jgi:Na+/melibiose symporter-like transporter
VFDFVPGGNNAQPALDGLLVTYALGTAAGLFVAFLALLGYPLNKQAHDKIRAQLALRQAVR